jgi:F-type H+-transporting ATPase subunit epsilon
MAQVVSGQLHCTIVTPERQVVEAPADFVVLTAHDGQIGVLPEHSALLCKLGAGVLRIDNNHDKQYFFVGGGFAEVRDNRVTVLTPQAVPADQLDLQAIEHEADEAQKLPTAGEADRKKRQAAMATARGKRATYLESHTKG